MRTPVSLGVVGLGSRGSDLVRAFDQLASAEVRWLFDQSPVAVMRAWRRVSYTRVAGRLEDLLEDETLDAVVIATPPPTRCELAARALAAGKHVLIEPPVALEAEEAEDLACRAESADRRLVTGHALHFHPAAQRLKQLLAEGRLGQIHYLYGSHQGLGRSGGETVLWGAGAEAVSTLLWALDDEPVEALARGGPCSGADGADVAFCHLRFATGIEAELRLSCVEPAPARQLTAVGSRGMARFDALDAARPLTVHETGTDADGAACPGDVVSPWLAAADPVRDHCEHFLAAVSAPSTATGKPGPTHPAAVVAVLEALQRSLERSGTREAIGAPGAPIAGVIRLPIRSR
jgi:predicted dehydrogenase